MDGFGFIDGDTMTYGSAWAGHERSTATLRPGVVSSEDPNYWMVGGPPGSGGLEPVPMPVPLEERLYSAGHRVDHLDLDENGFVKDGTFDPGFSGQEYVNKKLEARGFKGACCASCAGGAAGCDSGASVARAYNGLLGAVPDERLLDGRDPLDAVFSSTNTNVDTANLGVAEDCFGCKAKWNSGLWAEATPIYKQDGKCDWEETKLGDRTMANCVPVEPPVCFVKVKIKVDRKRDRGKAGQDRIFFYKSSATKNNKHNKPDWERPRYGGLPFEETLQARHCGDMEMLKAVMLHDSGDEEPIAVAWAWCTLCTTDEQYRGNGGKDPAGGGDKLEKPQHSNVRDWLDGKPPDNPNEPLPKPAKPVHAPKFC